jgi:carboxypeptidase Q
VRLFPSLSLIFALIFGTTFTQQPQTQPAPPSNVTQRPAEQQPTVKLPPPRVRADDYREQAARIIGAALSADRAYRRLAYLTDRIGNRLSGSENLERAIEWALAEMKRDGLENVRGEKVMVPHWVRGEESLELTSPVSRKLAMLGLGNSVGTPPAGVTAEAIVVRTFDELEARASEVKGKIVVYNAPFTNYGATVQYRGAGASRAAKYGAVAALVRSVTPVSLQSPHTGAMNYAADQPKIPTAAITIEAAEMLQRMQERGEHPTLTLKMQAKFLPDAESANVVAELKGREKPDEIVLVSGHFDSWDVGQGAHDDGGSCIAAWEAVRLLKELNLRPRRTVRVVLWTNEENGTRGGNAYHDAHRDELGKHVLVVESDEGIYRPLGLGLAANAPLQARADLEELAKLLTVIRAGRIGADGGGTDIEPMMRDGVIGAGLDSDNERYFDIHHTQADTIDKIDPNDLAFVVATLAVMAYAVAEAPTALNAPVNVSAGK